LVVPAEKTTLSAAMLEAAVSEWVPPANRREVPGDAWKAPEEVPPPEKLSVPACNVTVPELLNGMTTVVVPVPADFLNVAAGLFVNGPGAPRLSSDASL